MARSEEPGMSAQRSWAKNVEDGVRCFFIFCDIKVMYRCTTSGRDLDCVVWQKQSTPPPLGCRNMSGKKEKSTLPYLGRQNIPAGTTIVRGDRQVWAYACLALRYALPKNKNARNSLSQISHDVERDGVVACFGLRCTTCSTAD